MQSLAIKVGLVALLLVTVGISSRALSTFDSPTRDFAVFMIQPSTSILRFEETGHACGGANHSWGTGYITYNGKHLSLNGEYYSSRSKATEKLGSMIQSATTIQETGPKYNHDGQIVGERVVAVEDNERALIVWTQGRSVFAITSESLECAMEFERTRIEFLSQD